MALNRHSSGITGNDRTALNTENLAEGMLFENIEAGYAYILNAAHRTVGSFIIKVDSPKLVDDDSHPCPLLSCQVPGTL